MTDVSGGAPAKMAAPTAVATAGSLTSLDVRWTEPANEGPAITDYDVQYREAGATGWTDHPHTGTGRTTTIASLTERQPYEVQVRATNADGTGEWSDPGRGVPGGLVFTSADAFEVKEHERAAGRVRVRDLAAERDLDACRRQGDRLSLGGADAARFTIACSGALSFREAPDFETPRDAGGDNARATTSTRWR